MQWTQCSKCGDWLPPNEYAVRICPGVDFTGELCTALLVVNTEQQPTNDLPKEEIELSCFLRDSVII